MTKKDKMIEALITDDIDTIINQNTSDYLSTILFEGFVGYKNQTSKELKQECIERFGEGRSEF